MIAFHIFRQPCWSEHGSLAEWWKSEGVYQLVERTSLTREYHDLLLCTDSIEAVVKHCLAHAHANCLPLFQKVWNVYLVVLLLTTLIQEEELNEPFWVSKKVKDMYKKQEEEAREKGFVEYTLNWKSDSQLA